MMKQDDGAFEDRKKSQEAQYKLEEERRFKIRSRRNKLTGLWIADRLGMDDGQAQDLAKEVVMAGLEAIDNESLVSRIRQMVEKAGKEPPDVDMIAVLSEMEEKARQQIMDEFPAALGTDHQAVGDSPYAKN